MTSAPSLPVFRQRLKTFLFRRSYPGIVVQQLFLVFRTCHCFVVPALISYLGHVEPFYDDADDGGGERRWFRGLPTEFQGLESSLCFITNITDNDDHVYHTVP